MPRRGGCETTPWHSQGLRERGGDCTENKPLSVQLVPSRLGTTLHSAGGGLLCIRPGHISLFLYNQINSKCLQPDLWNARSSRRISAHLNFWEHCHPVHPDLPEVPAVIKKILSLKRFCAATGVTTNPRIQKKEGGVQNCALQLQTLSICASTKSTRRTSRLQKDDVHLQGFFQLHQAKN